MKRTILYLALLLICSVVNAQVQQGIVKTRGRLTANGQLIPGVRLSGATISVKNGGSYVSDNNGAFSLSIPSKTFYLTNVQKQGYQLCDRDVLGKSYQYSANPIMVVMETPDNTTADRLAAEKKIRRTLQRQLQEKEDEIETLKEQQKISEEQYRKELRDLYAAQESNEKLISEMAERYSTLDFDQMDEFQRQVTFFIENGELTRADSLLNTKGSMAERSAELDRMNAVIAQKENEITKAKEIRNKILQDFLDDCTHRAQIHILKNQPDSVYYYVKLRANKDTIQFNNQLIAATYAIRFGELELAKLFTSRVLNNGTEDNEYTAYAYDCMGDILEKEMKFDKAIDFYKKELEIEETLGIEFMVDWCLKKIGDAFVKLKLYDDALFYYYKGLSKSKEGWENDHCDLSIQNFNHKISITYYLKKEFQEAIESEIQALDCCMEDYNYYYGGLEEDTTKRLYSKINSYAMNIWGYYAEAQHNGILTNGFNDFIQDYIVTAETIDEDSPAKTQGMNGEYILLEFEKWTMDGNTNLLNKSEELRGKPKTILVMKDGIVTQYHFEDFIGIELSLKYKKQDEKQRIIEAYRNWKNNN